MCCTEAVSKVKPRGQEVDDQLETDLYGDLLPESFHDDSGLQDRVQEVKITQLAACKDDGGLMMVDIAWPACLAQACHGSASTF